MLVMAGLSAVDSFRQFSALFSNFTLAFRSPRPRVRFFCRLPQLLPHGVEINVGRPSPLWAEGDL